jgi:MFS transporter, DHA1 family, tetracycline resistance protein
VAAAFGVAAAISVILFVRETSPKSNAPRPGTRAARLREAFAHPVIGRVLIISFVVVSGFAGIEATYGLWTQTRFGWGPRQIGLAFFGIGALGAFCQGWLTGRLVRRHGEARVLTAGLCFMWIGMVTQWASPVWPVAMVGFAFVCLGQSLCFPNLTALISQSAPHDRQGEMLGLNMSSNALARIGGPIYAGQLFSLVSPGAPFLLTAALILPALWFAGQVRHRVPNVA